MGFFGPFSEALEDDINYLSEFGHIIEESLGPKTRLRVNEETIDREFFDNYKEFLEIFQNSGQIEYKIVELFRDGLKTSSRIELAASIYQIIDLKEINLKKRVFIILERWKPRKFSNEEKEEVWEILIRYNVISENGEIKHYSNRVNSTWDEIELSMLPKEQIFRLNNKWNDFNKFEDFQSIIYREKFWINFIANTINRIECEFWDFKQTLDMWEAKKSLREIKQIDFCEKVAAFANKKGGVIIIGISDKMPRNIIGISDLENKMQSIRTTIKKWIDYQEDFIILKEIIIKVNNSHDRHCLAIVIAQTEEVVGVGNLNGRFSYPIRFETGLDRVSFNFLRKRKKIINKTNLDFLRFLK